MSATSASFAPVAALGLKDLRLLFRAKGRLFFTFVWPLLVSVMFGLLFGSPPRGTFVRLKMAPLTSTQILAGKALACFATLCLMQAMLLVVGLVGFGLEVESPLLFVLAVLSASSAFVGVMMLIASLGRTEESTSGAGWAVMMPMAMLGGAMIPLAVMPPWMLTFSHASPIKWAVLALEGAVWRGFGPADMLLPCGILLTIGLVTFSLGVRALK